MGKNFNQNLNDWHVPDTMTAFYYGGFTPSNDKETYLYIPVIMPLIDRAAPKISNEILDDSCFCNDSDCKPNVSPVCHSQNYIICSRHDNRDFKKPYINTGSEFFVQSINNNIDKLYLTTLKDPSIEYDEI